jgi:Fur family transcriptional regulator, peroxide stress response regulator
MDAEKMKVEAYLKEHGIKPSYQRIRIFEYLVRHKNHPNVDAIYQELSKDIPTLSRTTVYNTMKLFIEKKIVQLISIEDTETRYDADISAHGHFKCTSCGEIYDVHVDLTEMRVEGLEQFRVDETHLYFKGTCDECFTEKNQEYN